MQKTLVMMRKLFLCTLVLASFLACDPKDKENNNPDAPQPNNRNLKLSVLGIMQEWYYWYPEVPAVDVDNYPSADSLLSALMYKPLDHWSFLITETDYKSYFVSGSYVGHGFSLGLDEEGNIRIAFLYPGTQAHNAGVRRGWILKKVNGTTATPNNVFALMGASNTSVSNQFLFSNHSGANITLSLTKEDINIHPVLYSNVYTIGTTKVGYVVFQDYIDKAEAELNDVFDNFKFQGVSQVIVDLRYNGGGSLDVATHLGSLLAGTKAPGSNYVKLLYNEKHPEENVSSNLENLPSSLDASRVFFICSEGSASASELTMIGVDPYVETFFVGSSTSGKPYGMNGFDLTDWGYIFFPITFKYTNSEGYSDFVNGIVPDHNTADDLAHDFGNTDEACLRAALHYIEHGVFPMDVKRTTTQKLLITEGTGIGQFLRAI